MKKKITAIIMCSLIVFVSGISVAYYNTKSFGFDDNVKIISKDKEKISFMDFNIYYEDIETFFEKTREYMPERTTVIAVYAELSI